MVRGRVAGRLIVFEGPDGVGKTTLSRAAFSALQEQGVRCELMSFPGRDEGTLGRLIYKIHHAPDQYGVADITTTGLQVLHIAAHIDAIERRILPALDQGLTVLLDRYWWSTWVYGLVSGMGTAVLKNLISVEEAQWGPVRPDLAVLVRRAEPIDRIVSRPHWDELRDQYDRLAERERTRYPVAFLENAGTIHAAVEAALGAMGNHRSIGSRTQVPPSMSTPPMAMSRDLSPSLLPASSAPAQHAESALEPAAQLMLGIVPRSAPPPPPMATPTVLTHILPVVPTVVYDTYWRFAAERQAIFFRRLDGTPPPWTQDTVLDAHKFTNAYRASDRTSQYLIRRIIYRDDLPSAATEVFFRVMLFKLFNKIETWQLLEAALGDITLASYSFDAFDQVLSEALAAGKRIYSPAYIMPPGGRALGHVRKHRNHLALIELMLGDELPARLSEFKTMQQAYELLLHYPTIGPFLAYQYVTDLNYSELTHFTETEFAVPGPGARDGIQKCFTDRGGLNEPEILRFMADRQEREFERLGLSFQSLWGRRLQLIDCQNLFCEVDKYSRVRHPDIAGHSGRTRIKQRFVPNPHPVMPWYPPKWGLNDRIESEQRPHSMGSGRAAS
jgi:thymidylate kinase